MPSWGEDLSRSLIGFFIQKLVLHAPFTDAKHLKTMIGDGREGGCRRRNGALELFHCAEVDILRLSTAGADHMVVIVFIAKFIASASTKVDRAYKIFLDELLK